MKYTRCLGGMAVALLSLGSSLFGQSPEMTPVGHPVSPMSGPIVPSAQPAQPMISEWMAYPRSPICCGNVGKHGPIFAETYARGGVSIPLGLSPFTNDMNVGATFIGGMRTLLFNPTLDNAWVVDFGLRNTWWSITDSASFTLVNTPLPTPPGLPQQIGTQVVTPTRLHTMTFDLSLGQECYFVGNAACDGTPKWRAGWDFGGSYGSGRLDFQVIRHRTDTLGGFFGALHTDFECPFGSCIFNAGARVEYGYTFNDLLQRGNDTDVQAISALITLGVRF